MLTNYEYKINSVLLKKCLCFLSGILFTKITICIFKSLHLSKQILFLDSNGTKARIMLKLIKCLAFSLLISLQISAQKTTVWIVRHAEKDTSFISRMDPDLTAAGQQRALDLAVYLQKEDIVKVFSTDTKRTKQTAKHFKASLDIYTPKNLSGLLDVLYQQANGKSVLIVGHSNTVLETIEALGGARPVALLTDDDYDYLFKVVLADGKAAQVSSFHFGQYHRGGNATMK